MTQISEAAQVETLLATPDLADALDSEPFRRFLDQVPIAIVVSEMRDDERIVYVNPEFEKVSGESAADIIGQAWTVLQGKVDDSQREDALGVAIAETSDFIGTFRIERAADGPTVVDAYSNIIVDDDGKPSYRLAALLVVDTLDNEGREELEQRLREKDTRLLEIQHRVKNNLQMITALIRIEARKAQGRIDSAPFDRLAGRIESIQLLYSLFSDRGTEDE